jgi:tRNA 2-thiouridine synthesizing protein E
LRRASGEVFAMAAIQVGDEELVLDGNGFLQEPLRWNPEVAQAIARDEGIESMTEQHWSVVNYIRTYWQEHDLAPAVRLLCQNSHVSVRDMYKLFRSGPAKGACRIAGLPKPDGCV